MESPQIKRALISVSNKEGLVDFAAGLVEAGIEILSTGGTARTLTEAGIAVRDVSDYTGFPEMMDGRLKTLHPAVHGGLLCRHDNPEDIKSLDEHGILTIELVIVNLYPFLETISRPDVTTEQAIEQIDIGGPTMVRAAAKNHKFTSIVTSASQYDEVLAAIKADGCTTLEMRKKLAGDAFEHTACYDRAIADYFAAKVVAQPETAEEETLPPSIELKYTLRDQLRYGENPHQRAGIYIPAGGAAGGTVTDAEQLNGKELSYNNFLDLDAAYTIVRCLESPAVSVIKHNNSCGAAVCDDLAEAMRRGLAGDPLSAFGSVIGVNRTVDEATAEVLAEPGLFVEAIIAPEFSSEALEILKTKPKWKKNVRLLRTGPVGRPLPELAVRPIDGGLLVQDADLQADPEADWKVATETKPTDAQMVDLRLAWELVRHVKSNAIVLCKEGMLLGAGAGQMSRVDSVEISIKKAGDRAPGSVLGSDAFFPFPDSIEAAAAAGVSAVIQPGGSVNDDKVVKACDELGVAMILTGRRHFKH